MMEKEQIERSIVRTFLEAQELSYKKLISSPSDPPDVIVETENVVVGIEVTTLYTNVRQKELESQYENIFEAVNSRLLEEGITGFVVRIVPNKLEKVNRKESIKLIVDLCVDNFDKIKERRTPLITEPIRNIKSLVAYKSEENKNIVSFDTRKHLFGSIKKKELIRIIEHKIGKIEKNKLSDTETLDTEELWLLINIEGAFYSNYAGVEDTKIEIKETNCFKRIFVFHKEEKWIKEISVV